MGRALPLPVSPGKAPARRQREDLPRPGRVELPRGVDEIARVDDVIAVEHLARPPADQLHRDALDDAGADEVADGGPAEIMEDRPGTPAARHAVAQALLKLPIGAPFGRVKTCGMTRPSSRSRLRATARRRSKSARRSAVNGKTRPSPVFVVPGSSRTSPASKATFVQ